MDPIPFRIQEKFSVIHETEPDTELDPQVAILLPDSGSIVSLSQNLL